MVHLPGWRSVRIRAYWHVHHLSKDRFKSEWFGQMELKCKITSDLSENKNGWPNFKYISIEKTKLCLSVSLYKNQALGEI